MKPHIKQFIEFLKKKEGREVPLEVKLLNPKDFKITPEELNVKGSLDLDETRIQSLPDNLKIKRNLNLSRTPIQSLPDNLRVGWSLDLSYSKIKSLPNNLEVGKNLHLDFTQIESIPNNLTVRDTIFFQNTPLSDEYTEEEIESMIEEKGGFVGISVKIL